MKELSIEEKAKRFDEALAMAKECITYIPDDAVNKYMLNIFPELKELGDEEEVRKAMIDFFKHEREEGVTVLHYGVNIERMIAWLEKQGQQETDGWKEGNIIRHGGILALVIKGRRAMKSNGEIFTVQYPDEWVKAAPNEIEHFLNEFENQGEQKPFDYEDANIQQKDFAPKSAMEAAKEEKADNANKVELKDYSSIDPHFGKPAAKVETKFKVGDFIVNDYCSGKVIKITDDAYLLDTGQGIPFSCEHNAHLWNVTKDAKDGDVLAFYCEYKGNKMVQVGIIEKYVGKHGGCSNTFKIYVGMDWENNLKIGEYMGCPDIRPATKEQRDTLMKAMADAGYTFNFESKELRKIEKPIEWSYEDEANLNNIIWLCNNCIKGIETTWIPSQATKIKHLIETIKEEGLAQQNPAWSEEDEQIILSIEQAMNCASLLNIVPEKMDKIRTWLKSLKNRVGCEANCTTIKEWNESDKEEFQIAIDTLVEAGQHDSAHWLKSLKQRIGE